MSAFLAGTLFGALLMGGVFTVFITRSRRPRREIVDWTERAYEPPVTTTIKVNRYRSFDL